MLQSSGNKTIQVLPFNEADFTVIESDGSLFASNSSWKVTYGGGDMSFTPNPLQTSSEVKYVIRGLLPAENNSLKGILKHINHELTKGLKFDCPAEISIGNNGICILKIFNSNNEILGSYKFLIEHATSASVG